MLLAGQHGVEDHGHHESHGDAVRGEDLLEQCRELREDVAHLGEADADGQRKRRNRDVALREARLGNHLEARKNDVAEHHDRAAAEHRLRQRVEHLGDGRHEARQHQNQSAGENHLAVDDLGHGHQSDVLCERGQRQTAEQAGYGGDQAVAGDGARGLAFGGRTVQAHLGQRGGVTQHLDRGDDVEQADGDDRAPVELRLERHELRHGHDGEVLETGEIDLAHADSRHIADHQTHFRPRPERSQSVRKHRRCCCRR